MSWFTDVSALLADWGLVVAGAVLLLAGLATQIPGFGGLIGIATKPLGHVAVIAGVCIMCLGGGRLWLHEHDKAVLAQADVVREKAVAAATAAQAAANETALQQTAASAAAMAAQTVRVKEIFRNVPVSTGCIGSPAVRALAERVRATPSPGAAPAALP